MSAKWKKRNGSLIIDSVVENFKIKKSLIPLSAVAASIIIFDQQTKYFAPTWFSSIACNRGFAFGIYQSFLNGFIAFLVLLGVIYVFIRNKSSDISFGLALIIGGGVSNIIDRLIRGCVMDFIQWSSLGELPLPSWLQSSLARWPAFNLADAAITIGVGVIIFSLLTNFRCSIPNDR